MFVPSYQMHNVLNVYSKQLREHITSIKRKNESEKSPADRVNLTPAGKRRATLEKVSKDILEKITRFGTQYGSDNEPAERATEGTEKETAGANEEASTFVFNVIDTINQKQRNALSVEDSSFLIKRLEQLSKKVGDKKTGSWG